MKALVDNGATCSFISQEFVKEHNLPVVSRSGVIQGAMTGSDCNQVGEIHGVEIRNGTKKIVATLEVGSMEKYTMIISLDLFKPLGYEIHNVPVLFPKDEEEVKPLKMKITQGTDAKKELAYFEIGTDGIANKWKGILDDNGKIPVGATCFLEESVVHINTGNKPPQYIRQYPVPHAMGKRMIQRAKEWATNTWTVIAPRNCPYNSPAIGARKPGKDGKPDGVRVCFDGRQLKRIIDNPDTNLPSLREIQDAFGSFEWISVIDLADSYNQFPIKPDDRENCLQLG